MVNTILARRVNHIVAKGDNPAWPKGAKSRGFSNLLKDGMKSGLDGLLSSTKKSPQKKETAPAKAEKEPAVHCNFVIDKSVHTRMKFLAIEKNMSLRDIVNEAMREYIEKNGK